MHSILLSLASNQQQRQHLGQAREALAKVLSEPVYTSELWTEPEGKNARCGTLYLNQLVRASTPLSVAELTLRLKEIETDLGRNDDSRRQGIVPIDIDLLLYDGQRHHLRDWQRNYVARLLEEL